MVPVCLWPPKRCVAMACLVASGGPSGSSRDAACSALLAPSSLRVVNQARASSDPTVPVRPVLALAPLPERQRYSHAHPPQGDTSHPPDRATRPSQSPRPCRDVGGCFALLQDQGRHRDMGSWGPGYEPEWPGSAAGCSGERPAPQRQRGTCSSTLKLLPHLAPSQRLTIAGAHLAPLCTAHAKVESIFPSGPLCLSFPVGAAGDKHLSLLRGL